MAWWPLDLAEGVRQALGLPGVEGIRWLLAATCAPGESAALFEAERDVCLVTAYPHSGPFVTDSVRRLVRTVSEASGSPLTEPGKPASSADWPGLLAVPVSGPGCPRRVLVVVGADAESAGLATRSRAQQLAPLVGLVAELELARRRARQADKQLADVEQMLRLAKPGHDVETISQELLDLGARLMEADLGALWLPGRRGSDLELRASRRAPGTGGPPRWLTRRAVAPLLEAAALSCPPSPLALPRELLADPSIAAAIVAPVQHDDEVVALLILARLAGRPPFGLGEAERLRSLADVASLPVAAVCLRQELRVRRRQLRAAQRIGAAIPVSLAPDDLWRAAVREVRRLVPFDAAAIVALDENAGTGQVVAGEPGQAPRVTAWQPELSDTVTGAAMRRQRIVRTGDDAAARAALPFVRELEDVRATISFPLVADGVTLGALVLASQTGGRFRRAEARLLRPIARQLASALRQARARGNTVGGPEERLRLEARLLRAERHATIGRLAGALAHEIRNPLTVIATTVQYLRDRLPPEHEDRALLDAADRKVHEMDGWLEDLLTFSRPLELRPEPADPRALLDAVAGAVRGRAERQGVEVTVGADGTLPAVRLDSRLMEQAVLHLALHALDAMPGGGRLAFGARPAPQEPNLLLTVADTGPGIPEAELGELFEPHRGIRRRSGGLGLAVARRIVEEHGGAIEALSDPGRGTTFLIVLPAGGVAPGCGDG